MVLVFRLICANSSAARYPSQRDGLIGEERLVLRSSSDWVGHLRACASTLNTIRSGWSPGGRSLRHCQKHTKLRAQPSLQLHASFQFAVTVSCLTGHARLAIRYSQFIRQTSSTMAQICLTTSITSSVITLDVPGIDLTVGHGILSFGLI